MPRPDLAHDVRGPIPPDRSTSTAVLPRHGWRLTLLAGTRSALLLLACASLAKANGEPPEGTGSRTGAVPAETALEPSTPMLAIPPSMPLPPEDVISVPPELAELVQNRVVQHSRQPDDRLEKLVEFMFSPSGLDLQYDDTTRTVAQTFADRKGNCWSFTLLFVQMARLAGLEAEMQESEKVLISFSNTDTLVYTGHVSASVQVHRRTREVQFDPSNPIIRGAINVVSTERSLAHYYNNRGAELMLAGHAAEADAHFARSVELEPTMVQAYSNRGVLHMRQQQHAQAEQQFRQALLLDPTSITVLSNLVSLYRSMGDAAREAEMAERLRLSQNNDPYHHFIHGLQFESKGDMKRALEHYKAAAELDSRQPLYHLGLARAYAGLGDNKLARRHADRATRITRRQSAETSMTSFSAYAYRRNRD